MIHRTDTGVSPLTWDEFRAAVAELVAPPACTPDHARAVRRCLDDVAALDLSREGEPPRTIGSTAELTVGLVARFVRSRPPAWSPFTLKKHLAVLRIVCSAAVELGALAVNPFAVRPVARWVRTGRPPGRRHLSRVERQRLIAVLDADVASRKGWEAWKAHRLRVAVLSALYCGFRRNELLRSQVGDIDLPGRTWHVKPHGTRLKTDGSAAPVPIPEALVPVLDRWLTSWRLAGPDGWPVPDCPWTIPGITRQGPWTGGGPRSRAHDAIKRLGERAGVPWVCWQALRRTCSTMLVASGVPPGLAAQILRHSQQVDALFYQGRDLDELKRAARDLVI